MFPKAECRHNGWLIYWRPCLRVLCQVHRFDTASMALTSGTGQKWLLNMEQLPLVIHYVSPYFYHMILMYKVNLINNCCYSVPILIHLAYSDQNHKPLSDSTSTDPNI